MNRKLLFLLAGLISGLYLSCASAAEPSPGVARGQNELTNIYTDAKTGTRLTVSSGRLQLVPTFENCSYYINRTPAERGKKCGIKIYYREKDAADWKNVLDPVYMERENAWRGSIMLLKENTPYEFKAVISGEAEAEIRGVFRTRSSDFRIGKTVVLDETNFKGYLSDIVSGRPDGYTLYKAKPGFVLKGRKDLPGGVIDCRNAQYVIFDGLTIDANGSRHAISLDHCSDVAVRNCDISNFGRSEGIRDLKQLGRWTVRGKVVNYDGGIILHGGSRHLIERCFIHSPHSTANSWFYSHPAGPSAVCVDRTLGGTVLRCNDFIGSDSRRWNDAVESCGNGLIDGGFCRDADIYGNLFAYANDDCIEIEGGEMNVRVYFNRFQGALCGVSTGSCRLGPSYQYRNVYCRLGDENNFMGNAFKNSHGTQGDGAIFLISNTVYVPGANGGFGSFSSKKPRYNPPLKAWTCNNVITSSRRYADKDWADWNTEIGSDLFHGSSDEVKKQMQTLLKSRRTGKNVIFADPRFVDPDHGDLHLAPDSPARGRAAKVPGLETVHLGALQEDGIDIPYRPIPVELDKKEITFNRATAGRTFEVVMTANGKGFSDTFKVHCNDSFFTVTPSEGKVKSGQKITFKVKLNSADIKQPALHNGMMLVRFSGGFSRAVSVYADFRNDPALRAETLKSVVKVEDLKSADGVYTGKVTIPEDGCYFLFVRGNFLNNCRAEVAFGEFKGPAGGGFRKFRRKPDSAYLFAGNISNSFFILKKGSWPFTCTAAKDAKFDQFLLTRTPEKLLRSESVP